MASSAKTTPAISKQKSKESVNTVGNISGKLLLTICSANLLRDVDTFGKQDPFVTLNLAEQFWSWKSKVVESGGKTPNWNETVEIPVKNQEQDMLLKVMDDDLGSLEEMVCSALVPIKSLCVSNGFDGDIKLDFKGKDSGTIRLKATFEPDKSP